jgi:hypothetical protein
MTAEKVWMVGCWVCVGVLLLGYYWWSLELVTVGWLMLVSHIAKGGQDG